MSLTRRQATVVVPSRAWIARIANIRHDPHLVTSAAASQPAFAEVAKFGLTRRTRLAVLCLLSALLLLTVFDAGFRQRDRTLFARQKPEAVAESSRRIAFPIYGRLLTADDMLHRIVTTLAARSYTRIWCMTGSWIRRIDWAAYLC